MPKTLKAVYCIDARVWPDGRIIKLIGKVLAQAKKAAVLPEAFYRLTADEQDAFYVFLSRC